MALDGYPRPGAGHSGAAADWTDAFADSAPVGSYPAGQSPYGALDMSGNVYEWLADWYDTHAYDLPIISDPTGPASGENRVIRGGAFGFREGFSMAVFRDWETPETASRNLGFRCMQAP